MHYLRRTAAIAAAFLVLYGCGPAEPTYYHVSGTIKFDGKPIPKGTIYFEPKGKGQQGRSDLVDGKYDTKSPGGKGVLGGPYNIRIGGYDGKVAYEAPYGAALFPEYTTTKDLEAKEQTLDFDIPKGKRN